MREAGPWGHLHKPEIAGDVGRERPFANSPVWHLWGETMHTTRRARRVLATVLTGAVIVAGSLFGGSAATAVPTTPPPASIAALGDSITQALMTCSSLSGCPANSWSTGTAVSSHAARLAIPTTARFNLSKSGAKSIDLPGQATAAVTTGAQYVTIEIGANDACTSTVGGMTDPNVFAASVSTALATLAASPAHPQIFVAAIPNLKTLYTVNAGNASARFTWSLLRVCQSMLAKPTSTALTDTARRDQVQAQVDLYNAALQTACLATTNCHFAASVGGKDAFVRADISTRDYFHPSLAGQATLARLAATDLGWKPFIVAG